MSVAFVTSEPAASASGTSTTLNRPGSQTAGDLVLIYADIFNSGFTNNQNTPSGFTLLAGRDDHTLQSSTRSTYLFGKMTTADEPASYTLTRTNSSGAEYLAMRFSGTELSQLDANKSDCIDRRLNLATTSHIGNAVLSLGDDSMLLYIASTRFGHAGSGWSPPGGMTLISEIGFSWSVLRQSVGAGSTGTRTATTSFNRDTSVYMVTLSPPVAATGRPWWAGRQNQVIA